MTLQNPSDHPSNKEYLDKFKNFIDAFRLSPQQQNDNLQKAAFLYGLQVPQHLMIKEVKDIRSLSLDYKEPVYTIQFLQQLIGTDNIPKNWFEDGKGSVRSLMTLRKRLLNKAFQIGLLTSFMLPINQTPDILAKNQYFLTDKQLQKRLDNCFDPNDERPSKRKEILQYLNNKNQLSDSERFENYFYMQHKVVKSYLQTFLGKESDAFKLVDDMVLKASENRTIAGRILNVWILENKVNLLNETFFEATLNNPTFIRQLFSGRGSANEYIKDSEAWKIGGFKMHNLTGTEWCNVIGDLQNQFSTNFQEHITKHLCDRVVAYLKRFAMDHLECTKECIIDKTTHITFNGGSFALCNLRKAVENGYFKKGLFPEILADKLKHFLTMVSLKDDEAFNPEIDPCNTMMTFEKFVEPVILYYNEKMDMNKHKLTKNDLFILMDKMNVKYVKSEKLFCQMNRVREAIGLSKIDTEPSKEAFEYHKDFKKYSFVNRVKSWNNGFHPKTLALHLYLRENVPLPRISNKEKESSNRKDDKLPTRIFLSSDDDYLQFKKTSASKKDKGWSPCPITSLGRVCIRIDKKTLGCIDKNKSLEEYFNVNPIALRQIKKQIRNSVRRSKDKKKVNYRRQFNGLGNYPKTSSGWKLTSVMTDGIIMVCHYEKKRMVMSLSKTQPTNEDIAKELYNKYKEKVRCIGADNGRVILVTTAEKTIDGDWKHKQIKRSSYYSNTGISKYNESLEKEKPQCIKMVEQEMSQLGGWRCRTVDGYKTMLSKYVNLWHNVMFEHYSDIKFSKARMFIWRRKRSYIQQRISDIFKGDKSQPIIYVEGAAKFASSGKGEIGGAPTSKLAQEFATKIKQMRNTGWNIVNIKVNEGMTSQIHHRCGKRMKSIKDPETNNILRSWKCCVHCKAPEKHDNLLESDVVGLVVHRDKNAAKNIHKLGLCLLQQKERPDELCFHCHK